MICNVFLSTSTIIPFTFKTRRFLKKRPAVKVETMHFPISDYVDIQRFYIGLACCLRLHFFEKLVYYKF